MALVSPSDVVERNYEVRFNAPETEVSREFLQGIADRMAMSWFKYGNVADAYPKKVNAIESLMLRLVRYMGVDRFRAAAESVLAKMERVDQEPHRRASNNTEYLIDAGNFAMIEFMRPSIEGAFYEPTDSNGSPGRVGVFGTISQSSNDFEREQARTGKSFYKRDGD